MRKPRGYWTKEHCHEEALKYNTRLDFDNAPNSAYLISCQNGWIDDICSHMTIRRHSPNHWTKDVCETEALKYKTRGEFLRGSRAYDISRRNGWLDDVCKHMNTNSHHLPKMGYAYEFSDNWVYIGITCRERDRNTKHLNNPESPVHRHIKESGLTPIKKILFQFTSPEQAKIQEGYWIEYYKSNKWNLLNTAPAGSLGGIDIIWTKEKCHEEALKYKSKSEFIKYRKGAVSAAVRNGYFNEICSHMVRPEPKNKKWRYEECKKVALGCKSKKEFIKNFGSVYTASKRKGWYSEISSHMTSTQRQPKFWNDKENCRKAATECKKRSEFNKKYVRASVVSRKNGWLDEFFPKK